MLNSVRKTVRNHPRVLPIFSTVFFVALLWKHPLFLTLTLTLIAAFLIKISEHPKREFWFALHCGTLGACFEVVAIWTGAWHYSKPSFAAIPIWLPSLWAIAALTVHQIARKLKV